MLKVTWFNALLRVTRMSRTALRQVVPVVQTTVFDAYIVGLAPLGTARYHQPVKPQRQHA